MATESVNDEEAAQILEREWKHVQGDEGDEYVDDPTIRSKISEVLNGSQKTFKYILVNAALAKATNPDVHYRSLQANSDLSGAYDARSVGHAALVPWEKAHGERLGGSPEPFVNNPARHPDVNTSNRSAAPSAQERLYNLLERMQEKTEAGDVQPVDVLRQMLSAYGELDAQTVDFESPSTAPFDVIETKVDEYLRDSGGGERLPAVIAGVLKTYYVHAGEGDWTVDAEHANVSDQFSEAAGDVEIFFDGDLRKAVEVKDKPVTRSAVQHAVEKARENELGEYLYVIGAGFANGEETDVRAEVADAPIELILATPADFVSTLKLVDDVDRVSFLESVGEFLNDMRADPTNKDDFKTIVESIEEA